MSLLKKLHIGKNKELLVFKISISTGHTWEVVKPIGQATL